MNKGVLSNFETLDNTQLVKIKGGGDEGYNFWYGIGKWARQQYRGFCNWSNWCKG